MKYYGIHKGKLGSKLRFKIYKISQGIELLLIRDKKKLENKKGLYNEQFGKISKWDRDNSSPEGIYFQPIAMIINDFCSKEDLSKLENGIRDIYSKYSSKKMIPRGINEEDVVRVFRTLRESTYTDNDSYKLSGIFDFENSPESECNRRVHHFSIGLNNISGTFVSVEITVNFSDNERNIIEKLMLSNSNGDNKSIVRFIGLRKNKSLKTISTSNNNSAKFLEIQKRYVETEWIVLKQLSKYLPLNIHNSDIIPPTVIIDKTNFSEKEYKDNRDFSESIGLSYGYAEKLSEEETIIYEQMFEFPDYHQILVYVKDELKKKKDYFYSKDFQIQSEINELYGDIYTLQLLNVLNSKFKDEIVKFRDIINKLKISKRNYGKLLKTRFIFEKKLSENKKMFLEVDWDKQIKNVERRFSDIEDEKKYYRLLTETPLIERETLKKQYENIVNNLEEKIRLSGYASAFSSQKKSWGVAVLGVLIAIITLLLLIYPNLAEELRKFIARIAKELLKL